MLSFAVRQLNPVRLGYKGNDMDTTSMRDDFFEFIAWTSRMHGYGDLLYYSSIALQHTSTQCTNTISLCMVGGVWFAAGLFQTSCYYIPVTNQPHFDAACLASLRALEAFSPSKDLNAPNKHMSAEARLGNWK